VKASLRKVRRWLGLTAFGLAQNLLVAGNTATEPVPRDPNGVPPDSHWMERHETFVAQAHRGGIQVLFLGDSITDFWRDRAYWRPEDKVGAGQAVWEKYYVPLAAANFGIGADRTQHVLWRLLHGEMDGINPKVVVLLIGTNNIGLERNRPVPRNTTEEAIAGITAVVHTLRAGLPNSKILLLGLFPRGEKSDPIRAQVRTVNAALAQLEDGPSVHFLDLGAHFLQPDGEIRKEAMPDLLHPSEKGYAIWAEAMQAPLAELLK
jgi:lysophospholipase L1-like esterase